MNIESFVQRVRQAAEKRENPQERALLSAQIDRILDQLYVYLSFVEGDALPSVFERAKNEGLSVKDLPTIFQGQARKVVTAHPTSVVHIEGFKFLHGIQEVLLDLVEGRSVNEEKIQNLFNDIQTKPLIRDDKRKPETEANFAALSIQNYAQFSKVLIPRVWSSAKKAYPELQPDVFAQQILPFFVPAINTWAGGGDRDGNDAVTKDTLAESLKILKANIQNILLNQMNDHPSFSLEDVSGHLNNQDFSSALAALDVRLSHRRGF